MSIDIKTELYTCLFVFLIGLISAFIYDFFRVIKNKEKVKNISWLTQSIYFIIAGFLCFFVIRRINDGNLRLYEMLCFLLGFSLYRVLIGCRMLKILEVIMNVTEKIFLAIVKALLFPVVFLLKFLKTVFFKKILNFLHKIFKNTLTRTRNCFKIKMYVNKVKRVLKLK